MKPAPQIKMPPATKAVARDLVIVLRQFSNHVHERLNLPPSKGDKDKANRLIALNCWRAQLERVLNQ